MQSILNEIWLVKVSNNKLKLQTPASILLCYLFPISNAQNINETVVVLILVSYATWKLR